MSARLWVSLMPKLELPQEEQAIAGPFSASSFRLFGFLPSRQAR